MVRMYHYLVGEETDPMAVEAAQVLRTTLIPFRKAIAALQNERCNANNMLSVNAKSPKMRDVLSLHTSDIVDGLESGDIKFQSVPIVTLFNPVQSEWLKQAKENDLFVHVSQHDKAHADSASIRSLDTATTIKLNCAESFKIGVGSSTGQIPHFDYNYIPAMTADDSVHRLDDFRTYAFGSCNAPIPEGKKVEFTSIHSGYYISPQDIVKEAIAAEMKSGIPIEEHKFHFVFNHYSTASGSCGDASHIVRGGEIIQLTGCDYDGYTHSSKNIQAHLQPTSVVRVHNPKRWCNPIRVIACPFLRKLAKMKGDRINGIVARNPIWGGQLKSAVDESYDLLPYQDYTLVRLRKRCEWSNTVRSVVRVFRGHKDAADVPLPSVKPGKYVAVEYTVLGTKHYANMLRTDFSEMKNVGAYTMERRMMERRIRTHLTKNNRLDTLPDEAIAQLAKDLYNPDRADTPDAIDSVADIPAHYTTYSMLNFTRRERRPVLTYYGPQPEPRATPSVFADTLENEKLAVLCRALKIPPTPLEGAWDDLDRYIREVLEPEFEWEKIDEYSPSEVHDTLQGTKRQAAVEADRIMEEEGIQPADVQPSTSAFIKVEKGNCRVVAACKAPRLIQGPDINTKTCTSRFTIPFGKMLANKWAGGLDGCRDNRTRIFYPSGRSPIEVGAWRKLLEEDGFIDGAVETDFSRFDSTIGVEALNIEYDCYKRLGCSRGLVDLFRKTIKTKGLTAHGIKYTLTGGRPSGATNTSCGNTWMNGNAHMHIMDAMVGPSNYRLAVLGDDMVAYFNSEGNELFDPDLYIQYLKNLGWNPVLQDVTAVTASFCSQNFVPCLIDGVDTYILAPKVGRGCFRFGWGNNTEPLTDPQVRGVIASQPGIAVVPGLNRMAGRVLNRVGWGEIQLPSWMNLSFDANRHVVEVCSLTDYFYMERYGNTYKGLQDAFERLGRDRFTERMLCAED